MKTLIKYTITRTKQCLRMAFIRNSFSTKFRNLIHFMLPCKYFAGADCAGLLIIVNTHQVFLKMQKTVWFLDYSCCVTDLYGYQNVN